MAVRRIFMAALMLVALTEVAPTTAADAIAMQGKEPDAAAYKAASNLYIRAAEEDMKAAAVASSPQEAAAAQKAASEKMVAAMGFAFKGATADAPTTLDAMQGKKEPDTVAAATYKAASSLYIRSAEKDMEAAAVASSPQEAAAARKVASEKMIAAMGFAFKGALADAPPTADAMQGKEADTISAVGAKTKVAAASKDYMGAAEEDMKEAAVASSPQEAAAAQKAASNKMVAAMGYAFKGAAAVAPAAAADATTKDVGYKA